jgi:drug/metabolite transporter (DMT)-like permease
MVAALLTTLFFSFSAIFAARSIRHVGATVANLGRLGVAFVCLGTYAHLVGLGMGGAGRDMFLWSGVVGMGLGDLALFAALPLLGSRLTVLVAQCVAVPVAMLAEWLWLDTRLSWVEIGWATVILAGVAMALMPSKSHPPRVPVRLLGLVMGLLAAAGQGLGAVMSRRAYEITTLAGDSIDGITAAYQRITGGLVITLLFFAGRALWRRWRAAPTAPTEAVPPPAGVSVTRWWWMGAGFIVANALAGPVIGVSCYQWALASTPSGIVLPIVATTPLVIIPLSYWIEGERPTRRSLAGGVVAVLGVVALTLVR